MHKCKGALGSTGTKGALTSGLVLNRVQRGQLRLPSLAKSSARFGWIWFWGTTTWITWAWVAASTTILQMTPSHRRSLAQWLSNCLLGGERDPLVSAAGNTCRPRCSRTIVSSSSLPFSSSHRAWSQSELTGTASRWVPGASTTPTSRRSSSEVASADASSPSTGYLESTSALVCSRSGQCCIW